LSNSKAALTTAETGTGARLDLREFPPS
jgi:hypothetical protein